MESTRQAQYPDGFYTTEPIKDTTKAVRVSNKKEYVSGGAYGNAGTQGILRHDFGYLSRLFGDDVYKGMLRDPEISKGITVIKNGVLGDGVTISPAIKEVDPEYDKAKEISDFCARAFENLERPFVETLRSMLDALVYGHKVAEITYELVKDGVDKDKLTLAAVRVKHRRAVAFVVDRFLRVLGFKAGVPVVTVDEQGQRHERIEQVILPREKFMLLTFHVEDEDPRGNSILESVYNAWHIKMQVWGEYMRWLVQCALPGLVGYLPPVEERTFLRDENGEIKRDANDNPIYADEVDNLLNALVNMRNASAIALPHGAKVEPINNSVSGDPFKAVRDVLNEEIEMGILLQTLATSEGRNMSRSAAETHMSVLDQFIWDIKGLLCETIRKDILKNLVIYNFGAENLHLLPIVSMGDTERREFSKDAEALSKIGYQIGESQLPACDRILGIEGRDIAADRASAQEAAAAQQSQTVGNPKKPAPKGEQK